jgi:hypothetical protein
MTIRDDDKQWFCPNCKRRSVHRKEVISVLCTCGENMEVENDRRKINN